MPKPKKKIHYPIKMVIIIYFNFYFFLLIFFFLFFNFFIRENSKFSKIHKNSVIIAEKIHDQILNGVETFEKSGMHHVETAEHNPLPTVEGLLYLDHYK